MLDQIHQCIRARASDGAAPPCRPLLIDSSRGAVDGAIFLMFPAGAREPGFVAKAAATPAGRRIFLADHDNLVALAAAGMGASTPTPLAAIATEAMLVTLQSALPGTPLREQRGAALFGAAALPRTIDCVTRWWQSFVDATGIERAPLDEALYEREVAEPTRRFLGRFLVTDDERRFLEERSLGARPLFGRELPLMRRHGDLSPANMVLRGAGAAGQIAVFDWELPLSPRLPLFDLFYFFTSTRFPHDVRGGESGHFESFCAVLWGDNRLARALRATLSGACARYKIAAELLPDLLLAAIVDVANLKFEALLETHGLPDPGAALSETEKRTLWQRLGVQETDELFACIAAGASMNMRALVQRGLPGVS